jgi:putative hemolysin
MQRNALSTASALLGALFLAACGPSQATHTQEAGLPNPASLYCEENGGTLELRADSSGAVAGICVFQDGGECDEWAYFRGECEPGAGTDPTPASSPNPEATTAAASESAADGCRLYRNEALGYSFHVPQSATVSPNDDPLAGLTISGPATEPEGWPQIAISHPMNREDFRPPEDVDLAQWLTDHNLLGDERQEDVEIAGMIAVHLRHDRSPQSYAYDRYYFAARGQLYEIVIGHVADREDWEVYDHFLESFRSE